MENKPERMTFCAMKKKLLVAAIPKRDRKGFKDIKYIVHGKEEYITEATIFPSIAIMDRIIEDASEVRVLPVITEDSCGTPKENLEEFRAKVNEIAQKTGKNILIENEVWVSNDETRQKQIDLFKNVCECYRDEEEVYMDVTYGTKVTSLVLFSSLSYAEKIRDCTIRSVIYGNAFGQSEKEAMGDIYDVRCLYEFSMLMSSVDGMPREFAKEIIEDLWR